MKLETRRPGRAASSLALATVLAGLLGLGVSGCAPGSAPLVEILSSLRPGASDGAQAKFNQLNPSFRYLRAEATGRAPVLLVLGYLDPHPLGEVEVWYSAGQETLKLQNGRIVATAGLEFDWRATSYQGNPPHWSGTVQFPAAYGRSRDEAPQRRYGVTEQVKVERLPTRPAISLPSSLPGTQADAYTWFSESYAASSPHASPDVLPNSWFAIDDRAPHATVVYSEQCLSASFCLKLQAWPLKSPGP